MCKQPYSYVSYVLVEDAIDVLEVTLNYVPRIATNLTTVSLLKYLREKISNGQIKAFKRDEWC
jgi:flagellar biosynthesis protein FliQ